MAMTGLFQALTGQGVKTKVGPISIDPTTQKSDYKKLSSSVTSPVGIRLQTEDGTPDRQESSRYTYSSPKDILTQTAF